MPACWRHPRRKNSNSPGGPTTGPHREEGVQRVRGRQPRGPKRPQQRRQRRQPRALRGGWGGGEAGCRNRRRRERAAACRGPDPRERRGPRRPGPSVPHAGPDVGGCRDAPLFHPGCRPPPPTPAAPAATAAAARPTRRARRCRPPAGRRPPGRLCSWRPRRRWAARRRAAAGAWSRSRAPLGLFWGERGEGCGAVGAAGGRGAARAPAARRAGAAVEPRDGPRRGEGPSPPLVVGP
jgi:hypothetical protein